MNSKPFLNPYHYAPNDDPKALITKIYNDYSNTDKKEHLIMMDGIHHVTQCDWNVFMNLGVNMGFFFHGRLPPTDNATRLLLHSWLALEFMHKTGFGNSDLKIFSNLLAPIRDKYVQYDVRMED